MTGGSGRNTKLNFNAELGWYKNIENSGTYHFLNR
jgi:hypothetical protein